ncbi:MAG: nucleoside triphosphate pyrophosphohydrolase [candidate division Zixibacteria bacterium]|nr:nucleoside triphosphate pyrophosphohydrolase [Candidatus Tariuqbacter arcticus]
MNENTDDKYPAVASLAEIMTRLRAPDGCPWDREQDHMSLRPYLIEEAYEVLSAIESSDSESLKNELGDLLLHIVFHAQIADENGNFDLNDVAQTCVEKLIRRHPHVFGDTKADTPKQVKDNWEAIKITDEKRSLFAGVPAHLPALLAAFRVQEKAAGVGFDWKDVAGVDDKLQEEWSEFQSARQSGDTERMEEEFGDLLFVLVNLGKWLSIDAELSLNRTVHKFIRRFQYIEEKLAERGTSPHESTLEEMDAIWNEAKDEIK